VKSSLIFGSRYDDDHFIVPPNKIEIFCDGELSSTTKYLFNRDYIQAAYGGIRAEDSLYIVVPLF